MVVHPSALMLAGVLGLLPADVREPVRLPNGTAIREVSFERHVASLLGKHGCSAGACHGSFQGKGGFRLSLFGHDPEMDYVALTREALGRRINRTEPDSSLMLLKPSGQVPHGGGKRFDKNSWTYQVIRAWIADGCRRGSGTGAVKQVRVLPAEHVFPGPGETVALKVQVEFADGSRGDLTPFCEFRAQDDFIAQVSPLGEVRGLRPGETPVIVSYRGNLAVARVLVPAPVEKGFIYPSIPAKNYIDREVFTKLRRLNIVPSQLSSDTEFLRRLTIDTIGTLPAPDQIRAFLADRRADKRTRKIDELLAHPWHAALWATRFCDITACNLDTMEGPAELKAKRAKMWHDWFRRRVADNMPYDQIVHGVLCATSREGKSITGWIGKEAALGQAMTKGFKTPYAGRSGLDLFWRRFSGEEYFPLEQMAELTAAAFLGVRIECAQCHKHPFDRWTQADYRAYANVFGQVQFGSSPEIRAAVADLLAERRQKPGKAGPAFPRVREVYTNKEQPRRLLDPDKSVILQAKALGGPALGEDADPREQLYRWLVAKDNPFFAKSFVNRVWANHFGRGLVEPVDNFSVANPASNEHLLEALARDFTDHGYDIRRLERTILNSRAYQLSALPNATNRGDRTHYSHALARPMLAEVVVDVLNSALGTTEDLGPDVPAGSRAIEVAPNRVRGADHVARIFRLFGRPDRAATCDCERPREPAIGQTLFLMADPVLLKKIDSGRLRKLLADKKSNAEIIDELFLATLCRLPDDREKQTVLERVQTSKDRKTAFVDMLWALINTREFILNH